MPVLRINQVSVVGLSGLVPPQITYNVDYEYVSLAERQRLIQATGIHERRRFGAHVKMSRAVLPPAQALLGALGWAADSVDVLVLVTQMPDHMMPHTSARIQHELGLSPHCMALDLNLGCSGFVYGFTVAASLVQSGHLKRALLVCGNLSDVYDAPRDPSVAVLFGDAVTVLALEHNPDAQPVYALMGTNGAGEHALTVPAPLGTRLRPEDLQDTEIRPGVWNSATKLHMRATDVFSFALREVAKNIRSLLAYTGQTLADYDQLILHQANGMLLQAIGKQLGLPSSKIPLSLPLYGNTNSASIPLTLLYALDPNTPALNIYLPAEPSPDFRQVGQALASTHRGNLRLLCTGFGVGFSWGSVAFTLPEGFRYVSLFATNPSEA